jgi:hypothetical protein
MSRSFVMATKKLQLSSCVLMRSMRGGFKLIAVLLQAE